MSGERPQYSRARLVMLLAHYFELADGHLRLHEDDALDQVQLDEGGRPRVRKRVHTAAPFESPICMKADLDDALRQLDSWTRRCVWGHGVIGHPLADLADMFGTDVDRVTRGFWRGVGQMTRYLNRGSEEE